MTLCKNICALRKQAGMTQDALAAKLGVTYQAVSKWENGLSCPDLQLLPTLSDIFGVSIDSLFGREVPVTETQQPAETPDALVPVTAAEQELPWEDDDTLYVVLYHGHELITTNPFPIGDMCRGIPFVYEGPALNINSALSVQVEGDVEGSVYAGGDVECSDVGGDVSSGGSVECSDVGGSVTASDNIGCGDVGGNAESGGDLNCGDVAGNVNASGSVSCGDVDGDVQAYGNTDCGDVGGNVRAGGNLSCDDVDGNVSAGGSVRCGDVAGYVNADGADCAYMDAEWQQKMNDLNRASADFAKQKVDEATARLREASQKAREKAHKQTNSWHYEFDNGTKVEIKLEDKVDGIVNGVEKMLDGLFDGLSFGKKKNKDTTDE